MTDFPLFRVLSLTLAAWAGLWTGCSSRGPTPAAPVQLSEDQKTAFPAAASETTNPNDWYRWRGPHLDGVSKETGWTAEWPPSGPPQLWKSSVGTGFSSVSIQGGRLFTMGNQNDTDTVYCLNAENGQEIWKYSYPCALHDKYYAGGPNSTPAVDGSVVYTLSKAGDVFCLDAASGKVVWGKNLQRELGAAAPSWGFAGSPVVEGNLLILNVGDYGTALDKKTGKVVWKTGRGASGYSSPVPFKTGTQRAVAIFAGSAVVGVNLTDGDVLWEFPWKTSYEVNAADPIVHGNQVFITSGYGTGCALVEFDGDSASLVWKNKAIRSQFSSALLWNGSIYGMDGQGGDSRANLKCLDWKTGNVLWSEPISGTGTLMAADGKLIVLSGMGELLIVEAKQNEFKALARAQVLGGTCWTAPVLSNGLIYCRNARGDLVCLDVRKQRAAAN